MSLLSMSSGTQNCTQQSNFSENVVRMRTMTPRMVKNVLLHRNSSYLAKSLTNPPSKLAKSKLRHTGIIIRMVGLVALFHISSREKRGAINSFVIKYGLLLPDVPHYW